MSNIVDDALDFVSDVFEDIGDFVEDVFDEVEDFVQDIGDFLQESLIELFGIDDAIEDALPEQIDGTKITTRSATARIPIVYGVRRVGGNIIYMTTSGANNDFLYIVYSLADGPCSSISNIFVNGELIDGAKYGPYTTYQNANGAHTTQPFTDLQSVDSNWTADHKMLSTVGSAIRFTWNRDVWSGIPNVEFEVTGRLLYDPRTTTTAYSNNPALCIWDYLTNADYGKGLDTSKLNTQSFIDAANYCEQQITSYFGGPTHDRFECDAVVDTRLRIIDNLKILLRSCRGALPYINGQFYLIPEKDYATSFDFNPDNIIGSWNFNTGGISERYNRVKAVFPNKAKEYTSDYVIVESTVFRIEDNGKLLQKDITLPDVTDVYRAIDTASVIMRKSRQLLRVQFTATIEALKVQVGDVVSVTHPTPGWSAKTFRVTRMTLLRTGNVSVSLSEHEPTVYDLSVPNEVTLPPDTNLPDPTNTDLLVITGLSLASDEARLELLSDGTLMSRIYVSWDVAASVFVNGYEVQYKKSVDSNWLPVVTHNSPTAISTYIPNVVDSVNYDVRVRAVNTNDMFGPWSLVSNHTVIGKTSNPADVTGFSSGIAENLIRLTWDQNVELDFKEYEIRVGASWAAGTFVDVTSSTEYIISGSVLGAFTYWIKARDTTNNESVNAVSAVVNITGASAVASISSNILTVKGSTITLSWSSAVQGSFAVIEYAIRYGGADWDSATVSARVASTEYIIPEDWVGDRTFRIRPVDIYGNLGGEATTILSVILPSAPTLVKNAIVGSQLEIEWHNDANTGTFPIYNFEIKYDNGSGTFAAATHLFITDTDAFNKTVDWAGTRRFWIAPIDILGNYGTELTVTSVINPPLATTVIPQVIDNNVLLRWSNTQNTLPVDYYEIRKGETYGASQFIGNISALFFVIFETVAGTYKYWVTGVDTAGNFGVNNSISTVVSEPPDYVLLLNAVDDFQTVDVNWTGRTLVNAFVNSVGNLILPADTTQTWTTHFTNNAWTTIQDQINAGFPIYIQPTPATASYETLYDYGTVLNNLSVTISVTKDVIAGDATFTLTIETSDEDTASPTIWTAYPSTSNDSLKVFVSAFRHVRITIDIGSSADDTDLIEISDISLVIDVKEKTDAGNIQAISTDTGAGYANGTLVTLNKPFVDIAAISLTPNLNGTTEDDYTAIFNFEDLPNPTSFRVLLFDGAGVRVSGPVAWTVRGY